jgi:ATP-dependent Clp protease adaptor protein ClpS
VSRVSDTRIGRGAHPNRALRDNAAVAAPMPTEVEPTELERPESEEVVELDMPWVTLVWNDPVNLMSYVSYVFRSYFGYPKSKADKLMLQVHHEGRAVVSTGTREEMERDVEAMHGYGLWATLQKADA